MWFFQSQLSMFRNSNIVVHEPSLVGGFNWKMMEWKSVWDELTFPTVSGKSNQIPWFQSPPTSSSPFESGPQLGPLKFPSNSPSSHQVIPLSPIPKSSHGICRSAAWNFLTFQSGNGTVPNGVRDSSRSAGACVYKSHVTLVYGRYFDIHWHTYHGL
jgi:hypothetical protein